MKLQIHHRTCYRYGRNVTFGPHQLRCRPRESHGMRLEKFSLEISPSYRLRWIRDLHENNVGLLDLTAASSELVIESKAVVEVGGENPFDFIISPAAAEYPFVYDYDGRSELSALCDPLFPCDAERVRSWLHPIWHPGRHRGTLELLQDLNNAIYREIKYQKRERRGVQSPAETLEKRSGSCRDFAALFMEAGRILGLATRFVSGYMYSSEISGRMSMHGWAEVYLPGAGWIGFDPSWGILADSQYIPVAVTRHPEHAPPISGTYLGTSRDFIQTDVDLYVERIDEPAPVYSSTLNDGARRQHREIAEPNFTT